MNRAFAVLFARLVLGLIFFMAGCMKVFQLGPLEHARKYFLPFTDTFLPVWSLWATGVAIPFVELIAGALMILGLRTREALIALGIVLVIVTFRPLTARCPLRFQRARYSASRPLAFRTLEPGTIRPIFVRLSFSPERAGLHQRVMRKASRGRQLTDRPLPGAQTVRSPEMTESPQDA